MKTPGLAVALAALVLSASGCLLVPVQSGHGPVRAERGGGKACPPGHVWSDGECHSRGKGHERKHHDD